MNWLVMPEIEQVEDEIRPNFVKRPKTSKNSKDTGSRVFTNFSTKVSFLQRCGKGFQKGNFGNVASNFANTFVTVADQLFLDARH